MSSQAALPGTGNGNGNEPRAGEAIRAEIGETRAEMGETLDALSAKLDVKSQAEARVDRAKGQVEARVDRAKGQVEAVYRRQPTAVLAGAAAAVALVAGMLIRRSRR